MDAPRFGEVLFNLAGMLVGKFAARTKALIDGILRHFKALIEQKIAELRRLFARGFGGDGQIKENLQPQEAVS